MAEEDSFVILGSSPMPSLTDEHPARSESDGSSSFSSLRRSQIAQESKIAENTEVQHSRPVTDSLKNNLFDAANTDLAAASPKTSIKTDADGQNVSKIEESEISMELITSCSVEETNGNGLNSIKSNASGTSSNTKSVQEAPQLNKQPESLRSVAQPASLASSFILGEVNADVLKASVYSQFPSICSMEACAEDVVKLQTFMTEYFDLKQTLLKVNDTMRQYYNQTLQWKENSQRVEGQYRQQLEECQKQIAALRNQNLELKRELETQMEQIKVMHELHQKDNKDLIQTISEKSAQISNMRSVIEKLEQQQLASFEYVQQGPSTSTKAQAAEYVPQAEHQQAMKALENRISILEAENKELSDSKPNYIDEINCLSVNLASAEELIKKFRADINLLKAKDIEKSETFDRYEAERLEMREELTLLRQQVELYSKDFEMERNSRQQLAKEKDDLLQDLRALQRRNQELIEEAEKRMQRLTERSLSNGGATGGAIKTESAQSIRAQSPSYNHPQRAVRQLPPPAAAPIGPMRCPICSKQFPSLTILQSHASTCFG